MGRNAADVQDRVRQLSEVAEHQGNRFAPPLMLVAWEDETYDEVVGRVSLILPVQSEQRKR